MEKEELKLWRNKTGYSQGQLARILGVDVMTISRWERGVMKIPSFLKWALAYVELKGDELKPKLKRVRMGKKGGKGNGSIGRVSSLPQKAKRKN
jgi:transcriptional regulator with XRE-family HTH domain